MIGNRYVHGGETGVIHFLEYFFRPVAVLQAIDKIHAQSSWYVTQSYALNSKKPCHIATPVGISMPFTGTHFLHQQADLSFQVPHRRNAHDFNSDTVINTMTKENGRAAELQNCRIQAAVGSGDDKFLAITDKLEEFAYFVHGSFSII